MFINFGVKIIYGGRLEMLWTENSNVGWFVVRFFRGQRFFRSLLETTSICLRVSVKPNPIGHVFETNIKACEPTIRGFMPL